MQMRSIWSYGHAAVSNRIRARRGETEPLHLLIGQEQGALRRRSGYPHKRTDEPGSIPDQLMHWVTPKYVHSCYNFPYAGQHGLCV